ncbi:MAG: hypothetical protein J6P44_07375 [Bacteroidales bacterium]|nr:hypothetical protein [Bacteroidales bacterium]
MQKTFRIRQYIKYIIHAENEFSLHSPFLFKFYTNVIKRKNDKKSSKKEQLIYNINKTFPDFQVINPCIQTNYQQIEEITQNDKTIIILDDIHANKANHNVWENIVACNRKFITIDLFHLGILIYNTDIFFPQNFILRF